MGTVFIKIRKTYADSYTITTFEFVKLQVLSNLIDSLVILSKLITQIFTKSKPPLNVHIAARTFYFVATVKILTIFSQRHIPSFDNTENAKTRSNENFFQDEHFLARFESNL